MRSPSAHLIVVIIVAVVTLGAYAGWYTFVSGESAAVAQLEHQIATADATASRANALRATLDSLAADEAKIQNYFVSDTAVVTFITQLEASGQPMGATVSVLSVSSGKTTTQPTLLFAVSVKGTFDSVMRTVGAIEQMPYDLTVSSLAVQLDGKHSWHADLNLVVGSMPTAAVPTTKTP